MLLTNTNFLALVVGRQVKAKCTLITEAVLVEVDAVVDVGVDALCSEKVKKGIQIMVRQIKLINIAHEQDLCSIVERAQNAPQRWSAVRAKSSSQDVHWHSALK